MNQYVGNVCQTTLHVPVCVSNATCSLLHFKKKKKCHVEARDNNAGFFFKKMQMKRTAVPVIAIGALITLAFVTVVSEKHSVVLTTEIELPPRITVGGCVNRSFPFLQNGGFVRYNKTHIIVLAVNGTDVQQLRDNMTCAGEKVVEGALNIVLEVRIDPAMWSTFDEQRITAVSWSDMAVVPYHSLYAWSGIFGQHAIVAEFAAKRGIHDAQLRTIVVDPLTYNSPFSPVSREFYKLLFLDTYPTKGMRDGDVFWSAGTLIFMPRIVMKQQFWSLPMDNTISLLRTSLYERFGTPQIASRQSVLFEPRQYSHRAGIHKQYRGYRPEVMDAILSMTQSNNLSLVKVDFKALTFRQQWNAVTSHTKIIVSEGSFSVWIPFLRKDAVCLMIYNHYGTGWHLRFAHLPVALLGHNRSIKMVFVSIEGLSTPSSVLLETELLTDVTPQVRVVTVPSNATFAAKLLTDVVGMNTPGFAIENDVAVFRGHDVKIKSGWL
ncbi:transmembrane protein, putative [Bodo saltans]|uniref:Transmembrane protein, putative n=1 Tax=Bodo saltans TaxID=75058 RepID=A0A0S4JD98_BODSA|nr:transmembrane protein, putative [Bodo saltans]|eukprot:CUG88392.1 transmembrane protein, putative [Bodo saltans]